MSARVAQLLNSESLGDRKPSEILTFLKTNVARNDISNDMLKELFISRMPEKVRMSLCTMPHASLDNLAAAADRMTETNRFTMFSGYDAPEYNQPAENRLLKTKLAALESKLDRLVCSNSSNQFETKPIFQKPQQSSQTSNIHSHQPQTLVENQVGYVIFIESLAIELSNANNRAIGELTTLFRKTTGIHVDSGRCG